MADEEKITVAGKRLIFPRSLDYVKVQGKRIIINKKLVRGDYRPGGKNGRDK